MPGRHASSVRPSRTGRTARGLVVVLAAVGVMGAAGGIGYAAHRMTSAGCSHTTALTVAADPDVAMAVGAVVRTASAEQLGCARLTVASTDSTVEQTALTSSTQRPDLWIPDSAARVATVAADGHASVVAAAVASTPVVVAAADRQSAPNWLGVLSRSDLLLGNPLTGGAPAGALGAALAEGDSVAKVAAALVPAAQARQSATAVDATADRLRGAASSTKVTIATEQQVSSATAKVSAFVPATGTILLTYPVANTASAAHSAAAERAGKALATLMRSARGRSALAASGLRPADGSALAGKGVGAVKLLAQSSDTSALSGVLTKFAALALPSRALVVEDVSGSMSAMATRTQSRMQLTVQASLVGSRLFSDRSQIGLWVFSTNLDGLGVDHKQLVPIRAMNAKVGSTTQRQVLGQQISTMGQYVGGGTGLYDTVLAAWRQVKQNYDPDAVNSVILLTDGKNEDSDSISLRQLLTAFTKEQDPSRPVIVVTIGITRDADAGVLATIARATGGTSYVARDPAQIPTVFVDAMKARTEGR